VEVADQFQEIGLLLYNNRPVSILEEVADTLVPPVERAGVSREQAPHAFRKRPTTGPDEEMCVI
jgi:hypothetical protein